MTKVVSRQLMILASLLLLSATQAVTAAEAFSLSDAEQWAISKDEKLKALEQQVASFEAKAVSDSTLPDPKLAVGFKNIPTDSFALSQEPMTQIMVGVKQMVPGGDKLTLKSQLSRDFAAKTQAAIDNQQRQIRFEVRRYWFRLVALNQIRELLKQKQQIFENLRSVTESLFSVGKKDQQDVFKAEVELGKVKEKLLANEQQRQVIIASLNRWIGDAPSDWQTISQFPNSALPKTAIDIVKLRASLMDSPILHMADQDVAAKRTSLKLAEQSYKPDWTFGLSYGLRDGNNPDGSSRTDFVSLDFAVDLPLFTANRQDKAVLASQNALSAADWSKQNTFAELRKKLDASWQDYRELSERVNYFQSGLIPLAVQHSDAAMDAYQRDAADFNDPMQAYNNQIQLKIEQSQLTSAMHTTMAMLRFLAGEF